MATWGSWKLGDKAWRDTAPRSYATRQPSRWRRNLVLIVLIGLGGWLVWSWHDLREEALVSTSYAARTGCECRFVSQRSLESCEGDLKELHLSGAARLVSLSEDTARHAMRASVPMLGAQSADFRPERGCQLEPWQE